VVVLVVVVDERSASGGRDVLLHPRGYFFHFRIIVRFGAVIAFGPATNLTFEVALRFAEIGESGGGTIKAMEESQVFHKGLAQPPRFFGRKVQSQWRISPQDY